MGIVESKIAGLGINWLGRLAQGTIGRALRKRRDDYKEITDILNQKPDELMRLYVEPDFQPYNPANSNEDEPDNIESVFRIPAYKWIDGFLVEPKRKDGRHVAFILSDAGMGKTSLLVMLKLTSISSFWPGIRFKLFKLGPSALFAIRKCPDPVNTVLLLDSLDEDPRAFGRIEERLETILKATQGFRQVIITCRTQFFPLRNNYERDGALIRISGFSCRVAYLSLFSERQIEEFLVKLYPKGARQISQAKKLILSMDSLRMRPMLLAHVEDLMEIRGAVTSWTRYTTYAALVESWLDREERKPNGIKAEDLRNGCHILAINLQRSQKRRTIGAGSLESLLNRWEAPEAIRNVKDFGGRSLLNLNSDGEYRFAHYSIQEFMVVDCMARYPEKMAGYSRELRYSDELVALLKSWIQEASEGWKAVLRGASLSYAELSGIILIEADLSGADLSGADLTGADLRRGDLSGADLSGADLTGADLRRADLGGAKLDRANLTKANLMEADVSRASLHEAKLNVANLSGASFGEANLKETELRQATLHGVNFRQAILDKAILMNADLSQADFRRAVLRNTNLRKSILNDADFTGARLSGDDLHETNLRQAKGDEYTLIEKARCRPPSWPKEASPGRRKKWINSLRLPKDHPLRQD